MVERLKRLSRLQRGNPVRARDFATYQASFPAPTAAGAQTWICPKTGRYNVYAWGPGGRGDTGTSDSFAGGSGALAIWQRVRLLAGAVATISVPELGATTAATTVALASKPVTLTAGRGGAGNGSSGGAGGIATGGDININGSVGRPYYVPGNAGRGTDGGTGGTRGDPGAPGYDGFRGGNASASVKSGAGSPGAGGKATSSPAEPANFGGAGLVIITRVA